MKLLEDCWMFNHWMKPPSINQSEGNLLFRIQFYPPAPPENNLSIPLLLLHQHDVLLASSSVVSWVVPDVITDIFFLVHAFSIMSHTISPHHGISNAAYYRIFMNEEGVLVELEESTNEEEAPQSTYSQQVYDFLMRVHLSIHQGAIIQTNISIYHYWKLANPLCGYIVDTDPSSQVGQIFSWNLFRVVTPLWWYYLFFLLRRCWRSKYWERLLGGQIWFLTRCTNGIQQQNFRTILCVGKSPDHEIYIVIGGLGFPSAASRLRAWQCSLLTPSACDSTSLRPHLAVQSAIKVLTFITRIYSIPISVFFRQNWAVAFCRHCSKLGSVFSLRHGRWLTHCVWFSTCISLWWKPLAV